MPGKSLEKYRLFIILSLVILTLITFFPALNNLLLNWDDDKLISDNPLIKHATWENVKGLYVADNHIFLTQLMFMGEYAAWGLNPVGYHLLNVIFHLVNVLLVYSLVKKVSGNQTIGLVTAILFAIHPMRVESVVWVAERKDVLYTLLYLSGLHVYLMYLKSRKIVPLLFVILIGYLSSVCKIQAVAFPFALFLLDFFYKRKLTFSSVFEKFTILYIVFMFELFGSPLSYGRLLVVLVLLFLYWRMENVQGGKKLPVVASVVLLLLISFFGRKYPVVIGFAMLQFFLEQRHLLQRFPKVKLPKIKPVVLIAAGAVLLLAAFFIFSDRFTYWNDSNESNTFAFVDRFFLAGYSFGFYLLKLIWPFGLSAVHAYPVKESGMFPQIYYIATAVSFLLVSGLTFFHFRIRKFHPLLIFGLL
ncbi:MAG: hypothetical protein KKA07_07325, partial [Bacteroidetes bacterium]|nr:hypothetical protein [Bacteroidota bacterium]